jgi:uncharacterized membrane protein YbaN (DUF454 family)
MVSKKTWRPLNPFIKFLMVAGGVICVILGVIGIVLPVLPTTPFFLLAAFLFLRSSQRMYRWLLTHKLFGNYIRNYIHHRAIGKGVKAFTLFLLWGTILYSIYLMDEILWLQILLFIIAIVVTVHILSLRSMPYKSKKNLHEGKK